MTTLSMEALSGLRDRSSKGPLKHVGTAVAAVVLLLALAVADADTRSGLLVVAGLTLAAGALAALTAGPRDRRPARRCCCWSCTWPSAATRRRWACCCSAASSACSTRCSPSG
jgi:hypothetical protein